VAPVNETDMVLFPEGLKALQEVAKEVGLDLRAYPKTFAARKEIKAHASSSMAK
jgi:hypothetical protein